MTPAECRVRAPLRPSNSLSAAASYGGRPRENINATDLRLEMGVREFQLSKISLYFHVYSVVVLSLADYHCRHLFMHVMFRVISFGCFLSVFLCTVC